MNRLHRVVIGTGLTIAAVVGAVAFELDRVVRYYRRPVPRHDFFKAVGTPLPTNAGDVRTATVPGPSATVFFASAVVSPAEFDALVNELGLVRSPPVLAQYPGALAGDPAADLGGWLSTDPNPDADTYFALRPGGQETAAKYVAGRLYLRDDAE